MSRGAPAPRRTLWAAVLGAACLALLAAAGWLQPAPRERLEEGADWEAAVALHGQFDLDGFSTFIVVLGPVTDPGSEPAVRALVQTLAAAPWHADVLAPWEVPGAGDGPLAELAQHPLVRDVLLTADGRGLLLPLRWAPERYAAFKGRVAAHFAELAQAARAALAGSGLEAEALGNWPIVAEQRAAFQRERERFQLGGALLGFLVASLAFRDVRATLLAGLPPLLGVGLALGALRLVGLGAAGFTGIVLPLLILTIGFTDALHLVIDAARHRRAGAATDGAAMDRAVRHLWRPCALTSLTTWIGFTSLALTDNPIVREFGLSCAAATLVSFASVMTLLPLLARTPLGKSLARIRPPRFAAALHSGEPGPPEGAASRAITAGVRRAVTQPRRTACAGVALTLACAWAAGQLTLDRKAASDLPASGSVARALSRVDRELGGVLPVYVRLDWDATAAPSAVLDAARRARAALAASAVVQPTLGPDRLVEAVALALPGPPASAAAAQPSPLRDRLAWAALAGAPPEWVAPVIDVAGRSAVLHARVPDAGSAVLLPVFERVRGALAEAEVPGVQLTLVGAQVAYLETVTAVARDLARSLVIAAVLILATLALAFRSLRLGLASVVPNALPVTASAAGLALFGIGVDVSALTALTLSLGIATDDTIHVLARWREARAAGEPVERAASGCVERTLPALALTTLTLSAAFLQLVTSDLATIQTFGALAATTLAAAFVADVWLLPAFLVSLARRR